MMTSSVNRRRQINQRCHTMHAPRSLYRLVPAILTLGLTLLARQGTAQSQRPPGGAPPAPARMTMPTSGAQWKGEGIFGKGLLYSSTEEPQYSVRAQRRDKDGMVEVHAQDTDIIIFMDGAATFVTGGSV